MILCQMAKIVCQFFFSTRYGKIGERSRTEMRVFLDMTLAFCEKALTDKNKVKITNL